MSKKFIPVAVALILALLFGGYWYLHYFNNNASLATGEKVHFTITKGMSTRDIANLLHEKKVINTPESFLLTAKVRRLDNALKAGNYEVVAGMSDAEILEIIAAGKTRYNVLTVPEASTINDIAKKIEKEHLGSAQAFKDAAVNFTPYPYMETSNPDVIYKAEGFAYPSTYYLSEGISEKDILSTMVKEFNKRLTQDVRDDLAKSAMPLRDVVNLAAMVEREATFKEEMPLIAGVFLKRLKLGMPIQSDTTVQYILGEQKENLTFDDLKIVSPYNTYLIKGLPPGPIANPSMEAIKAVLNPVDTDYLYFVADKTGHHRFTKTYEEHLQMIKQVNGENNQ
jgi:UPF0755 protein